MHAKAVEQPLEMDGRRARRERNKLAVIDAVVELLNEGVTRPAASEVAVRSGVSLASVFRYFDNLDELHTLAFERMSERMLPQTRIAFAPDASLATRIDALVDCRMRTYETIAGVARFGRTLAADSAVVADSLQRSRRFWHTQVTDLFARELAPLTRTQRRDVAALVDAALSFEAWDLLRTVHGLPQRTIADAWRATARLHLEQATARS